MRRAKSRLIQSLSAWTHIPKEMEKRIRFGRAILLVEGWQTLGINEQHLLMHTSYYVCYTLHTIVYTIIKWIQ